MVEDVLMVGYPDGLWDDHNGLRIMRRGVTATHVGSDFRGQREFLIDVCTIPGSSGSPVLLYRRGTTLSDSAKVKLLGVVYAVFTHDADGEILAEPVPTNSRSIVRTHIPMNLGIVLRATRLLDFTDELDRRSRTV
jgi:hypothetical protein